MAFKKFDNWEEAIKAGYPNSMGNGEYGQGGEIVDRSRYQKLFEAIGRMEWNAPPFELPDFRSKS